MAAQKSKTPPTQETIEDPMRAYCKEHGIRYLPDEPDHPIHKRGWIGVSSSPSRKSTESSPPNTDGQGS